MASISFFYCYSQDTYPIQYPYEALLKVLSLAQTGGHIPSPPQKKKKNKWGPKIPRRMKIVKKKERKDKKNQEK